nr:hypothetical protein SHINE37_10028 [Rhizobiaceae bacterium]
MDGGWLAGAGVMAVSFLSQIICARLICKQLTKGLIALLHDQRRHPAFLQGLGCRPAHSLRSRLAAVIRRLGPADAVLRAEWFPRDRP